MSDPDAREELRLLIRAFRANLAWQRRAGLYAVPAGTGTHDVSLPARGAMSAADALAGAPAGSSDDEPAITMQDLLAAADGHLPDPARRAAPLPAPVAVAGGHPDVQPGAPERMPATGARPRLPLAEVRAELGDCQRCKLAPTRTNIVFGVGAPDAPLMFIGEAPGEQEDLRGEPFVGPAGQLLDRMIEAMGWTRDTVYIANVLKCRPPRNRNPEEDEVAACRPFLQQQIDAVRPRVIVTLGKPAAHLILHTRASMTSLRGRFQEHGDIRVMPTFHPAFLLRKPGHKRDTWSDLKQVIAELERRGIRSPRPPKT